MFVHWEQAKEKATHTEAFSADDSEDVPLCIGQKCETDATTFMYSSGTGRWLLFGGDGAYVERHINLGQVGSNHDGLQMKRVFTG